jgi:tetratricopeptide (TPR) repeat protein
VSTQQFASVLLIFGLFASVLAFQDAQKKEVEEAMREGKAAFARNDMPKAIEWFARAASMNPDLAGAHRCWGESLMKQGRVTEAGDKFVEAYIAEPYGRLSRVAFLNWGNKSQINLAHPEIEIPANVAANNEKQTTLNLDPNLFKKSDGASSSAWMMYGLARSTWPNGEFAKNYPEEKKYRHSLKEEAEAMRSAIKVLEEKKIKDPAKIDPSLLLIMKLDKEGLLEPFILLALPDEGIVQDYIAYRKTNLDNLRRYVKTYVLNGGSAPQK